MKKLLLSILILSGLTVNASATSLTDVVTLFNIEQPDPEERTYHQLDAEYEYEVYTHDGKLVIEGKGDRVDITELKTGAYFLRFNGKTERIIIPGVAGS